MSENPAQTCWQKNSSWPLLTDRLRALSSERGEAIAVVCGEDRATYTQLWDQVRAATRYWGQKGLRRGDRVAVNLHNCLEAVVARYSVWLAGGVVVPMNHQSKSRDLRQWLEHSGARFLLHDAGNREIEPSVACLSYPPVCIAVGASRDARVTTWSDVLTAADGYEPLDSEIRPSDLALLLYTSGTTGRPKAVMLSHANLAANASAIVECLRLKPEDSVVSPLPFCHAYGSSVLHTHLSVGARIVIEQNHAFPYAVVDTLVRERPTGFSGVASTYALFLSRVSLGQYDLTSLRYVTQAGGPMAPALARRVLDAFPRAQLFVMYGQTEATARLTYLPPGQLGVKPGSVGIAVPGTTIQVRREDRTVAAVGEPGDVWASGPGVMQGYWRDPQATAAVLQDGWLKTGDVGHLDADGYLFLHGRRSDMIKTGAHRVHPLDVEEVIAELPAVAEAAVVGVDDELLGQVIKAFIVPVEPQALDVEAVRAHCRKRLPAYKRPRHIEMVACVPRTLSGKVRRVELAGCSTSWGEGAHG